MPLKFKKFEYTGPKKLADAVDVPVKKTRTVCYVSKERLRELLFNGEFGPTIAWVIFDKQGNKIFSGALPESHDPAKQGRIRVPGFVIDVGDFFK